MSPTQRTLKELRGRGYLAYILERWNQFAKRRQDMWGFDIIAVRQGEIALVQCTSMSNVSARVKKIADLETTPRLREAGFKLLVWGWDGPRLREVDVS